MADQVVQCEGKAAGDDLLRQNHGQQQAVVILGFLARHGAISLPRCVAKDMPTEVFLQHQRLR